MNCPIFTYQTRLALDVNQSAVLDVYAELYGRAERLFAAMQAGGTVSDLKLSAQVWHHRAPVQWIGRHGLTQERAAFALGVSRQMLNYYLSGAKPIPKTVWLACLGWETTCKKPRRAKHNANSAARV